MTDPENPVLGTLDLAPAGLHPELVALPVAAALGLVPDAWVAAIDPDLADTATFCAAYDIGPEISANCVVLSGKREGEVTWAAAIVLATTRADVNGVIRKLLNLRKVSFAPMDEAVTRTGMEYGGITPVGLPQGWQILIDSRVVQAGPVVIGSGLRRSKIVLDGASLTGLPGARVVEDLANPVG